MALDKEQIEAIAMRCVKICEEKKAADIVLFDKSKDSILADYFLVCCGTSLQHIHALAENLRRTLVGEGIRPRGLEGGSSQWIVLDYGVIMVHIMTPEMRRRYCLEELWDRNLIVYQGGEELPPQPSQPSGDIAWEGEDSFQDNEFEDDYEDESDDEFEDDYEDDGDDEFEDDYEDDLEIIDVDDEEEEEKQKPKKDEDEKGRLTLKDLFKDDDE